MRTKAALAEKRMILFYFAVLTCLFLCLAVSAPGESFVFDDFEYWDSPLNHGWQSSDYAYPVMGYEVGYGHQSTQIDLSEGSRVLMIHCIPSVFNGLQPYCMANYNLRDPDTGTVPEKTCFSYKVKAPISFEGFTQMRCCLLIKTRENEWLWLSYLPIEATGVQSLGDFSPLIPPPADLTAGLAGSPVRCLGYPAGREIQDSTWHCVVRNLQKDLDQAVEEGFLSAPQHLEGVYGIILSGNEYSVDEITFFDDLSLYENHHPFVWNPGPQFATLFEPFELIMYASDPEKAKLSFHIQVSGWGAHGTGGNELFSLKELGPDAADPCLMQDSSLQRAIVRFTPQVFEDLIVAVTVSDGYTNDTTMFPLSVVNYPVQNHPPVIQRSGMLSRFVAHVGETFTYRVKVFDKDYDQLTYSATINGLPNYQYGPWLESIIDPHTGLIKITPRFEGFFQITVTVRDTKGAIAQATWDLTVANPGSWLNHPPVRVVNVPSPQIVRAGELYTVATSLVDPDGDDLYYSTNIGSVTPDGTFSFLTYFPGQYSISIVAYDFQGGYAYQNFLLDVQPWWSY
ncbi:MAG: hypothetical protein AB1847_15605 [bacterium]